MRQPIEITCTRTRTLQMTQEDDVLVLQERSPEAKVKITPEELAAVMLNASGRFQERYVAHIEKLTNSVGIEPAPQPGGTPTPLFVHNCEHCIFLGSSIVPAAMIDTKTQPAGTAWADWYYCPATLAKSIVARFSDEPDHLHSASPAIFEEMARGFANRAFFGIGRDLYEVAVKHGVIK